MALIHLSDIPMTAEIRDLAVARYGEVVEMGLPDVPPDLPLVGSRDDSGENIFDRMYAVRNVCTELLRQAAKKSNDRVGILLGADTDVVFLSEFARCWRTNEGDLLVATAGRLRELKPSESHRLVPVLSNRGYVMAPDIYGDSVPEVEAGYGQFSLNGRIVKPVATPEEAWETVYSDSLMTSPLGPSEEKFLAESLAEK